MVRRIAKNAGIGWVHPHQLRHTLATQAINRGMRLESGAALLGHKNLEMTMVYARIADATVAEEYFDVTNQVDHLYATVTTGTRTMKLDPETDTSIELTRAEALVIHDWLSRHKDTGTTPGDGSEQAALNGLNTALDRTLVEPFQADFDQTVQAARAQLTTDSNPS